MYQSLILPSRIVYQEDGGVYGKTSTEYMIKAECFGTDQQSFKILF